MAELFRKSSLEKLSSSEQLDKMIVITPLSFWIALSGAGFIIISALIWSIFGRLPVNVETQGIYVNREGTYKVYSEVAGIVEEVAVEKQDVIKKGDIIAYLNSDEIQRQIDDFDRRIAMVEEITMDSTDDVVTADNRSLIDVKNQKLAVDSAIEAMEQTTVQVESDRAIVEKQTSASYSQFAATKASIIDQLSRERESYEKQKEKCVITSTVDGTVSNVALIPGGVLNQGSEVISVVQGDLDDNVVVCYVPLSIGKKVEEGMKVLIYPTTVNEQEYGHMVSTVESVDSYVTSTETMQKQLGNSNLVESFMRNGPVVATVCRLKEDSTTNSGYFWSSKKGAKLNIEEGTLVEANIVVEEKAPITMLIPYLKEKLTVKAKSGSESSTLE